MKPALFPILVAAVAVTVLDPISAQVVGGRKVEHYSVTGDWDFGDFGSAVTGMADINGDSVPDFIVGAPDRDFSTGRITAFSGADGSEIWHLDGEATGDELGHTVVNIRDINDDGVNDVAVSAPKNDEGAADAGKVYVLSGVDGSTLQSWYSSIPARNFARELGTADINNDGYLDLICGMSTASENGLILNGKIIIFNAKTGSTFLASELIGTQDAGYFGSSVTGVGDWDGDGHDDVAVGALGIEVNGMIFTGRVTVFSGSHLAGTPTGTPAIVNIFEGNQEQERFGTTIARVGDQDGDGIVDLLIGSPSWNEPLGTIDSGRATLWSGSTYALIESFENPLPSFSALFGASLASAGDVDNDGYRDMLIGALNYEVVPGERPGAAFVYSGRTHDLLQRHLGTEALGGMGRGVAGLGDIDGDGTQEYLVCTPYVDRNGLQSNGNVTVFGREAFLYQDKHTATGGDTINYEINFPTVGGQYKILGSLVGTGPTTYHGTEVPLGPLYIPITSNNYPAFTNNFYGNLNFAGKAYASMTLPPAIPQVTVYLAAVQSNSGLAVDMSSVVQILEIL